MEKSFQGAPQPLRLAFAEVYLSFWRDLHFHTLDLIPKLFSFEDYSMARWPVSRNRFIGQMVKLRVPFHVGRAFPFHFRLSVKTQ
jgi:hypothetical protein